MKKIMLSLVILLSLAFSCMFCISCGSKDESDDSHEPEIKLLVTKSSSHDNIRTAHPGEDITYTFTIENPGKENKSFEITDSVPENTEYKSGEATLRDGSLVFLGEVGAGLSKTVSYTVTVTEDRTKIGSVIKSDSAEFDGEKIECADVYIERTFNEHDREKLVTALYAMRESEMGGRNLIKFYYYIAFTHNNPITDEVADIANYLFLSTSDDTVGYADMVVPGLYGGVKISSVAEGRFVGKMAYSISIEDIFAGDFLIVLPSDTDISGAKMYVTDGEKLYDVTGKTTEVADKDKLLRNIQDSDYFAVLRPSFAMENEYFYRSEPLYKGENEIEKALLSVAEAFILRGDRMQYADTRLATDSTTATPIYRWERGKSPEDYTINEIGYSNCTAFCHDAYYEAFDWDYGNYKLYDAPTEMIEYLYYLTGSETEEEIARVEAEFYDTLQFGDIVYYRYSSTGSHGMLYLGNGNLMHCTGSLYNTSTSNYYEVQEAAIRYCRLETIFEEGNSRYLFQSEKTRTSIYIIRPLNLWNGAIPEVTENRIENMKGIVAEKISSHALGQTANPGDIITYTFKIFNANGYDVTVDVEDVIPEGTILIEDGTPTSAINLSWRLTLKAREEMLISYKVKISENAEYGAAILDSNYSTVCGVPVSATPIFVGRTLSEEEQNKLVDAAFRLVEEGNDTGIILANKIYKEAFGVDILSATDLESLRNEIFLPHGGVKKLAIEGHYAEMVAPTLYGGKNVINSERFLGERTRMLWERNLVVGDILFLQGKTTKGVYIYIGEGKMLDLRKLTERDAFERLEDALGWNEFAILRPSLVLE